MRINLFEKEEEKNKERLKELISARDEVELEINELYKSVQDFSTCAAKTDRIIKRINLKKTELKHCNTKIRKFKEKHGIDQDN